MVCITFTVTNLLRKNLNSSWIESRTKILASAGCSLEFYRAWDYYFSLCSALFEGGNIDVVQIMIEKRK